MNKRVTEAQNSAYENLVTADYEYTKIFSSALMLIKL